MKESTFPAPETIEDRYSFDSLFKGAITLRQHRKGYRFSLDAVLLAHFIRPRKNDTILDLGTGCGIVPLILTYRYGPQLHIEGIEVQESLAELAQANVAENGLEKSIIVSRADLRDIKKMFSPGTFRWVVCNPPYRHPADGRCSKGPEKAIARHELKAELQDVVTATSYLLDPGGRCAIIYPAAKLSRLITLLQSNNLIPKRLQIVYSYSEENPARLVLVEALKDGGEELEILPPFYVYEHKNGPYSKAMQKLYEPNR